MSDNDWLEGDKALVLATAHLEEAIGSEDASAGFEMDGKRKEADRYVARAHASAAIAQACATIALVQAINRHPAATEVPDVQARMQQWPDPPASINYRSFHCFESTTLRSGREVCAGCGFERQHTPLHSERGA